MLEEEENDNSLLFCCSCRYGNIIVGTPKVLSKVRKSSSMLCQAAAVCANIRDTSIVTRKVTVLASCTH